MNNVFESLKRSIGINTERERFDSYNLPSIEKVALRKAFQDESANLDEMVNATIVPAIDYTPVTTTVKLPSRAANSAVQLISDYYLYRAEKYWETDGIAFRSVNKLFELIMQSGFRMSAIDGEKSKAVDNLKSEFAALMVASKESPNIDRYIRRKIHEFCLYGNTFSQMIIGGYGNDKIKRIISGDPLAVSVLVNKNTGERMYYSVSNHMRRRGDIETHLKGTLGRYSSKYRSYAPNIFYMPNNYDKRLSIEEINHIMYLELPQVAISIPPIYPSISDILTLRSIEDDIALSSFQFGHPLIHSTVDDSNLTEPQIRAEVSGVRNAIDAMKGNGTLVTSARVKVAMIGYTGTVPDLVEYQKMFRQRIEKGIGVPDLFTGEGGGVGRQTSGTVEKSLYAMINDMGRVIAAGMSDMFQSLYNRNVAGKSGSSLYDPIPISFTFNESDREEKRTIEQHALTLYQGGAITHGEFRELIGKEKDPKIKDKYYHEISGEFESGIAAKTKSVVSPTNQKGQLESRKTKLD